MDIFSNGFNQTDKCYRGSSARLIFNFIIIWTFHIGLGVHTAMRGCLNGKQDAYDEVQRNPFISGVPKSRTKN